MANPWDNLSSGVPIDDEEEFRAVMGGTPAAPSNEFFNPDRPSSWGAEGDPSAVNRARRLEAQAARQPGAAPLPSVIDEDPLSEAEQDRIAGLAALKRRQMQLGLAPGEEPAETYAMQLSDRGRMQFAESLGMLGERRVVSGPRPGHGPTKAYTDTMLGGTRRAITDPFGRPVYDTVVNEEPIIGADGQPMLDPTNPDGGPLTRRVSHRGAQRFETDPGLLEEQRRATMQQQSAELNTARTQADLLQSTYDQQVALDQRLEGREMRRMQRIDAQRAQVDQAFSAVREATQDMLDSAEIDPDKGWGDKGVAAKIFAVLGAAMMGFAGMDGMGHINAVIQNSIDAQKANQDRARARVAATQGMQQSAENSWTALRAQLGDEATADEAFRLRSLLAIGAQAEALLADAQVQELTAAQTKFMTDLRTEIEESKLRLRLTAEANTPTVSQVRPMYSGAQADLLQARAKAGLEMEAKGLEGAVGTISDRQKQARDLGAREADAAADRAFKDRDLRIKEARNAASVSKTSAENRRMIAKETAVPNRIRQLAGDLLADIEANGGDVPGVGSVYIPGMGAPSHQLTAKARDFRRRLDALGEYDITDLTGAVSSEEQQKVIKAFLSGDESAIQGGLLEIQRAMDTYVNTIEGADPEAAEAIRRHTRKGPAGARGARVDGPRGSSTVVDEDDEDY